MKGTVFNDPLANYHLVPSHSILCEFFAFANIKLYKGYQILISCCLLASLCLASPIAPVKSVGDNEESPDQVSQSLNLTLDSTEEVGLITSETTSGEFSPISGLKMATLLLYLM